MPEPDADTRFAFNLPTGALLATPMDEAALFAGRASLVALRVAVFGVADRSCRLDDGMPFLGAESTTEDKGSGNVLAFLVVMTVLYSEPQVGSDGSGQSEGG